MNNTTVEVVNQYKNKIIRETPKILSLDDTVDDDLHKIYFIESEYINGKYHKVIATAFGATSCSCLDQTKNPYKSCNHMKILDEILEQCPNKIQKISYML